MKPSGLMIEVDGPKGKDGDMPSEPPGADSDVDMALDDAFEASRANNKQGFIDAMNAAIAAKCADMVAAGGEEH